jgi:hypothetical protein
MFRRRLGNARCVRAGTRIATAGAKSWNIESTP